MKLEDIVTKRLVLRELVLEDAEHVFYLLSNPEIVKTLNVTLNETIDQTKNLIQEYRSGIETNQKLPYAVIHKEGGEFMGVVILKKDLYNEEAYEYTMFLDPTYWGKGMATEIIKQLLEVAFKKVKTKNFRGYIMKSNIASGKALEKNGFQLEKIFRVPGIEEEIVSYLYTIQMYDENGN